MAAGLATGLTAGAVVAATRKSGSNSSEPTITRKLTNSQKVAVAIGGTAAIGGSVIAAKKLTSKKEGESRPLTPAEHLEEKLMDNSRVLETAAVMLKDFELRMAVAVVTGTNNPSLQKYEVIRKVRRKAMKTIAYKVATSPDARRYARKVAVGTLKDLYNDPEFRKSLAEYGKDKLKDARDTVERVAESVADYSDVIDEQASDKRENRSSLTKIAERAERDTILVGAALVSLFRGQIPDKESTKAIKSYADMYQADLRNRKRSDTDEDYVDELESVTELLAKVFGVVP